MAGIEDFIKMAAQNLGESEDTTRSATGALLGVIKDKADTGDFEQLTSAIPGASALLGGDSASEGEGGGGLLGGLGGMVSGLGGGLGGALGALGAIQKTGLSTDKIGGLVSQFMSFAKTNASEGLVQKLLGKVPELAKLVG